MVMDDSGFVLKIIIDHLVIPLINVISPLAPDLYDFFYANCMMIDDSDLFSFVKTIHHLVLLLHDHNT